MTDADKPAFARLVTGALAYWRQDTSEFTLQVWWEGCQRFELEQVSRALSQHAADPERGRFAPMLSDVVRALEGTQVDRSLLAWGRVHQAMAAVGGWRSVVFDQPAIHAAIGDMGGWSVLCRSLVADLPHLQRRFCELHRTYSARGAEDWQPVLIGDAEAANRGSGRPIAPPTLVGDPAGCALVMQGPQRAPALAAAAAAVRLTGPRPDGATAAAPVKAAA